MTSEQIKDIKKFMSSLLIDTAFDDFLVNEVTITTYNTFTIDGHIKKDFYTEEEFNSLPDNHLSFWKNVKPYCFNIIKGNKTPVYFKIIFALNSKISQEIVSHTDTSLTIDDVNELFLNIKYENGQLSYVTGTSLNIFSLDKSIEKSFDNYISNFISTLF